MRRDHLATFSLAPRFAGFAIQVEREARYLALSPFEATTLVETFKRPVPGKLQAELEHFHPGKKLFSNNGYLAILTKPL